MKRISVQRHAEWRIQLAAKTAFIADPADAELDEQIQVDPYSGDPPSRRKDSELARVLSILDELEERGNG